MGQNMDKGEQKEPSQEVGFALLCLLGERVATGTGPTHSCLKMQDGNELGLLTATVSVVSSVSS